MKNKLKRYGYKYVYRERISEHAREVSNGDSLKHIAQNTALEGKCICFCRVQMDLEFVNGTQVEI